MRAKHTFVLIAILVAIGSIIALKSLEPAKGTTTQTASAPNGAGGCAPGATCSVPAPTAGAPAATAQPTKPAGPAPAAPALPKLLDLGSEGCQACIEMAPILDQLKGELQGRVNVAFTDVFKDQTAADRYNVQTIPTQIFFDASGKELFRHIGFYPKAEMLAKLKELGMLKK